MLPCLSIVLQGGWEVGVPPLFSTLERLWLSAWYGHISDGLRVQNIGMETFIVVAQLNSAPCSSRCFAHIIRGHVWRLLRQLPITLLLRDISFCWLSPWWIPREHCLVLSDRDFLGARQRERVKLLNLFQSTALERSRSGNHARARQNVVLLHPIAGQQCFWCLLVAVVVSLSSYGAVKEERNKRVCRTQCSPHHNVRWVLANSS
jgi:hypothetical protein